MSDSSLDWIACGDNRQRLPSQDTNVVTGRKVNHAPARPDQPQQHTHLDVHQLRRRRRRQLIHPPIGHHQLLVKPV